MKKRIRINGIFMFLSGLGIVIFPKTFLRLPGDSIGLTTGVEILGVLLLLSGQILRISSRGYKSENSGNGHKLIKGGPYSLVRNPMYLGIIMIGLGVVLVLFKWWVVFIFFAGFLARYLILTLAEEKKLLKMFGNEYALYCRSTPRIFPAPGTLFKKKLSLYLPLKRKWFKSESVSFLAVLAGVTLLKCYSYAQR